MKNNQLQLLIISLGLFVSASSKNGGSHQSATTLSSFYFTANDTLIIYSVNQAAIENVYDLRTTLITGQYPDSVARRGSLSIRVIGDTVGRYGGDILMVTYVNHAGQTFYNTTGGGSYVVIDQYEKRYDGVVSGRFALTVSDGVSAVALTNGAFKTFYQE